MEEKPMLTLLLNYRGKEIPLTLAEAEDLRDALTLVIGESLENEDPGSWDRASPGTGPIFDPGPPWCGCSEQDPRYESEALRV